MEGLPGGSLLIVVNRGIPSLCGGITVGDEYGYDIKVNPLPAWRDYRERGQLMNKIGGPSIHRGITVQIFLFTTAYQIPSMRGGITVPK